MSLSVLTFGRDPASGKLEFHDFPAPGDERAGSESWRESVWGSDEVVGLGATYLPRLKEDDLYVENSELDQFEAECEMLIAYFSKTAHSGGSTVDRLYNFLIAIGRARTNKGGVHIG